MFQFVFSHINDLFSIMNVIPMVKKLLDTTSNPKDLDGTIRKLVPTLVPIIEGIAATLFPQLAPAFHLVAGAMVAFDPDKTKWLQQALNTILPDAEDLVVDGVYGPKTVKAVEQVQEHLGLGVDGWAGQITNTAIQFALNKLFAASPTPSAPPAEVLRLMMAPSVAPNIETTTESAMAAPA